MTYTIVDGKIHSTEGCELNVASHCNLACRSCSHMSPVVPKSLVDATDVYRDFSILGKYFRPRFVKLLGGEPLLHPGLLDVIAAVRSSGVSDHVLICTNGVLLHRMGPEFWQSVDELHISLYPGKGPNPEALTEIRRMAEHYEVDLKVFVFDFFREAYSEVGTGNTDLVQRIYSTCQVAHIWKCHTVFAGHFFLCPQSIYLPQVMGLDAEVAFRDAVEIVDSPQFAEDLWALLNSPEPLHACHQCLGSAGKLFVHEQQIRKEWRGHQQHTTEELLDEARLLTLEKDPYAHDGCSYILEQAPALDSIS